MAKFQAGKTRPSNSGRKKGTTNKFTADIKQMVIDALNNKGGVTYLEEQADKNPTAFIGLIGKTLPLTLATDPNKPLEHNVSITITPVKAR